MVTINFTDCIDYDEVPDLQQQRQKQQQLGFPMTSMEMAKGAHIPTTALKNQTNTYLNP